MYIDLTKKRKPAETLSRSINRPSQQDNNQVYSLSSLDNRSTGGLNILKVDDNGIYIKSNNFTDAIKKIAWS